MCRTLPLVVAITTLLATASEHEANGQVDTTPKAPADLNALKARRQVEALRREVKASEQQQKQRFDQLQKQQKRQLEQLQKENRQLQAQIEEIQTREAQAADDTEKERKKLQIYGWMDVSFQRSIGPEDEDNNFHGWLGPGTEMFTIGNLNLVVDGQPAEKWRVLVETRLTYSPDGKETYEVPGLVPYDRTDTTGGNLGDYKWGGVVIERAWIDWSPRDFFQLRLGQFFTPYGIWNLDHGTPVLIAVQAPLQLIAQVFPARQMGLQLHGTFFSAAERLEYALTVSNGRVPIGNTDLDRNKAIGGRLVLVTSRVGEIKLGFSWYAGQFTNTKNVIDTSQNVQPPILPRLDTEITAQLEEIVFGADLQFDYRGFGFRSEMVHGIVRYDDEHRTSEPLSAAFPFGMGVSTEPLADYTLFAIYNMVFYQLPWLDLRPYVSVEWFSVNDNIPWDNGYSLSAGLNYRPLPHLALKVEFNHVGFPNDPEYTTDEAFLTSINRAFYYVNLQAAVSF